MYFATLMHKDIAVLRFSMQSNGYVNKILEIKNKEYLPISLKNIEGAMELNEYLTNRRISEEREDVQQIKELHYYSQNLYCPLHYISLYDCYWIKYDGEKICWNDINLYLLPTIDDIFSVSTYIYQEEELSRDTANMTIPGKENIYCIRDEDNELWILKEVRMNNRDKYLQQKYKEYLPTIEGDYYIADNTLYYQLPIITSEDIEYIPFMEFYKTIKNNPIYNGLTEEELFFKTIEEYPILNIDNNDYIEKMIALDSHYHVNRNFNQFGLLRDSNTLEFKGFSPLFSF